MLDHALWGSAPLGYHAVNLMLWLGLLVLLARFYRTLGLEPAVASVALLLFVLNDSISIPVGWIANRNSLLEALFAVGAVGAAWSARAGPALALALAATLSKESGALVLLLVGVVLWLHGRARPAIAALTLFSAHLAFLAAAGYGTNSLFYATPWSDFGRCTSNALLLATGGVLALLGPVPLDVVTLAPKAAYVLGGLGLLVGWPLALWILRRAHGSSAWGLFVLWTVLLLAPQAGAAPSDRLLFVPAIGVAGLLALAWRAERARWSNRPRLRRIAVTVLALYVTLGSGLYLLAQNTAVLPAMARHVRENILATDIGPPAEARREVLVLQAENQMQAFALGATFGAERDDASVRFTILNGANRAVNWTRTDERTFELDFPERPLLEGPFERVYLTDAAPPAVGTRWTAAFFTVEARVVDSQGLRRIRVALDRTLDAPTLRFVRPVDGVLTRLAPPAIGATIELPEAVSTLPFVP
jgi:hypothetical protein